MIWKKNILIGQKEETIYRLRPPGVGFCLAIIVRIFTIGPSSHPSSVLVNVMVRMMRRRGDLL